LIVSRLKCGTLLSRVVGLNRADGDALLASLTAVAVDSPAEVAFLDDESFEQPTAGKTKAATRQTTVPRLAIPLPVASGFAMNPG
jgi:hypothetical protein